MNPTQIQQTIDAFFKYLEGVVSGNLYLSILVQSLQAIADQILPTIVASLTGGATTVQQVIDGLFAALETQLANRPILLWGVKALQGVADSAIPGFLASLGIK